MKPLENITIDMAFKQSVEKFPDNEAIVYCDTRLTYRELDKLIDDFALKFINLGIKHGSHVGIWCESEPNLVISMMAVERIGAVAVLINTSLKTKEVYSILDDTRVDFLLVGDGYKDADFKEIVKTYEFGISRLKNIIYIGQDTECSLTSINEIRAADNHYLDDFRDKVDPQDIGFILFTSGTTSKPRAVLGSQYSRANSGLQQADDLAASDSDRFLVAMPMFHCFCLTVNVMAALFSGACLCIPPSRHTNDILSTIDAEKCTVLSCVPALYRAIINKDNLSDFDLSSLRIGFIGGSSYPKDLFIEIEEKLQFTLLSSLGQTEATAGITTANIDDSIYERATTIGHPMNHLEIKIAEDKEILVRGYVVMSGYFRDPDGTKEAIDEDGYLHTGDLGFFNENGNIVLLGRKKDLIIRGGENISPLEIETCLSYNNSIEKAKVIGVPDKHYGEEIALCVILKRGSMLTEDDIKNSIKGELADYKVPKYVVFMDNFPETSSGKVKTSELKEKVINILSIGG